MKHINYFLIVLLSLSLAGCSAESSSVIVEVDSDSVTLISGQIAINTSEEGIFYDMANYSLSSSLSSGIEADTSLSLSSTLDGVDSLSSHDSWSSLPGELMFTLYSNDIFSYASLALVLFLEEDGLAGETDSSYLLPIRLSAGSTYYELSSDEVTVFTHDNSSVLDDTITFTVELNPSSLPSQVYSGVLSYEIVAVGDSDEPDDTDTLNDFVYAKFGQSIVGVNDDVETGLFTLESDNIVEVDTDVYFGNDNNDFFTYYNGTYTELELPDNFPELSGPAGTAYESSNEKVYFATKGGEGYLYIYDISSSSFQGYFSLNNKDFSGISTPPDANVLYGYDAENFELVTLDLATGDTLSTVALSGDLDGENFTFQNNGYDQLIYSGTGQLILIITTSTDDFMFDSTSPQTNYYEIDPGTGVITELTSITYERDTESSYSDNRDGDYTYLPESYGNSFVFEYEGGFRITSVSANSSIDSITNISSNLFVGNSSNECFILDNGVYTELSYPEEYDDSSFVGTAYNPDSHYAYFVSQSGEGYIYTYDLTTNTFLSSSSLANVDYYDVAYIDGLLYGAYYDYFTGISHLHILSTDGILMDVLTLSHPIDPYEGRTYDGSFQMDAHTDGRLVITSLDDTYGGLEHFFIDPESGTVSSN